MPYSDDECDLEYSDGGSGHMYNSHGQPMSKAEQRRSNKPIMEKRRRARINHCLNELKSLILDAMKKDPARHSKLEKADILEMTVKHLQNVQRQQLSQAVAADPHTLHKFKSGFNECAAEVNRYVSRLDGVEPAVRQRLVAHLSGCVTGLQQLAPFSFPGLGGGGMNQGVNLGIPGVGVGAGAGGGLGALGGGISGLLGNSPSVLQQVQLGGDINNNGNVSSRVQVGGGLQLIPSRLPSGEIALLLPNSANLLFPPAAPSDPQVQPKPPTSPCPSEQPLQISQSAPKSHHSAFTAVSLSVSTGRTTTPTFSPNCSQDEEEQSTSTTSTTTTSPETPPSSARALHLSRVAADSSTSTPESSRCRERDINANAISSPTSSVTEVKSEFKTVPGVCPPTMFVGASVGELPLGGRNVLDFSIKREFGGSLKRPSSDGSEAEAEAAPTKIPRYTVNVVSALSAPSPSSAPTSAPIRMHVHGTATSSTHLPAAVAVSGVCRENPSTSGAGAGAGGADEKGDMWRPW